MTHLWQGDSVNYFSSDKIGDANAQGERRCSCGAQLKLKHTIMDPSRGIIVRVFDCQCGERTWSEDRE